MFGQCHGPVWEYDDFSSCFQHDYLQTLFPLITCAISVVFLIAKVTLKVLATRRSESSKGVNGWHTTNGFGARYRDDPSVHDDSDDAASDVTDFDDEIARNAHLALHPTESAAKRTTYVEPDRPMGETTRVFLETLLVAAQVAIAILALVHDSWRQHGRTAEITGIAIWTYTLLLCNARLIITATSLVRFPTLWFHTAYLYGGQWFFSVMLFRSYIIHAPSNMSRNLMIISFSITSVLFAIALGSRPGNKAVQIEHEDGIPPAREATASIFSLATFGWVDGIVWTGYKKTLELSDVWNLMPRDKAAYVLADYRQVKKTSALAWHLLRYFRTSLLAQAAWACFGGLLTFLPTLLLRNILEYVENPDEVSANAAWLYVILLFVSGCASALIDGFALWIGRKICIRLRAIIIGEIYAKALRRKIGASAEKVLGEGAKSNDVKAGGPEKTFLQKIFSVFSSKKKADQNKNGQSQDGNKDAHEEDSGQVTSGAIINLMAVDSFKVAEICAYLHFLWAATPVQVIVAIVLLYQILGYSSIAGIGMMVILLPLNMFISGRFAKIQKKILAATDARIHTTNEVLTNIRIIKYFAWEQRFLENVDEKRRKELKLLRMRYVLWSVAATIWGGSPLVITFLSFSFYTFIEKKDLIPSVAFTALSLFQILRLPLDQLADMVAHVQESKVSVDRIEEFLNEEDTQKYKQLRHNSMDANDMVIGFDNATFAWGSAAELERDAAASFRMMELNMKFAIGKLNLVAGPTGSGKSSLLLALLGEMTKIKGQVHLPGGRSREDIPVDPRTGLADVVAYCAQQAWLVNDTVKQNIVFASKWDSKRYDRVVEACSLKKDFEILDDGDETLVGEKGVTLSGGQKQRIALARAVYSNAKHVLLDDILSAVDSHTAKWIFDKALMGPLMADRTCILVTHNIALCLPEAHLTVLLENGRVAASGSLQDILDSGKLNDDLAKSALNSREPSRPDTPQLDAGTSSISRPAPTPNGDANGLIDIDNLPTTADKKDDPLAGPAKATGSPSANAMKEGKAEGGVKIGMIIMYLWSMGGVWFWTTAALAFGLQQVSSVATNVWIRAWANSYAREQSRPATSHPIMSFNFLPGVGSLSICGSTGTCAFDHSSGTNGNHTYQSFGDVTATEETDAGYYLFVYAILALAYMGITFGRELLLFTGSLTASKTIHTRLITSVSRAQFRFFDSTPLGQIMNRFSKDIENIDQEIAPVAVGVVHCLASIITIVILISVITPGFLIAGVFISTMYFLIGKFYISSSRDLKRIESVQRSPLYQQFGETLTGMVTIRAYGDERRFIRENLNKINTHSRPFIYLWAANRWLAFRVDVAGGFVAFFAGVFVVLSVGKLDAGAAGLAMTYAVSFTENILWFVRLYSANEQNMNSVERIKEYLDVEQEAPAVIDDSRPASDWPSKGAIEFSNYSTRYRKDLEPVLRNLTFKISPCEKIGIVGRTGAGKSSMALALFRALEAEEGSISIDGVDISKIGLQDLRENIVMVPQDPTLFSGTIRSNLDPFGLFTDEEIFTALRRVQLIGASGNSTSPSSPARPTLEIDSANDTTASSSDSATTAVEQGNDGATTPATVDNKNIFTNLSSQVAESGTNLSQGQRQLLCLARALLKSPKVLLMDEATASIDYATDSKIQETIRELTNNTIITIAHRLKTIVDYDRVLVMERGRIVEYGEPWVLLSPDESPTTGDGVIRDSNRRWFRDMCETSGDLQALEQEALRSYKARRLVDDS